MTLQTIQHTFANLIGSNIKSLQRISGGRNSKTYRIVTVDGHKFAGKKYFSSNSDPRNRLDVEFTCLEFLWRHGVRSIPRPIRSDSQNGCALYEFIEGQPLISGRATPADIDQMVAFLARLKHLAAKPESSSLSPASEACFSGRDVADIIFSRLRRLQTHVLQSGAARILDFFLTHEFIPAAEKLIERCKQIYERSDLSFEADIRPEEQTLSPSDFGLHNALVRPDGSMVFFDFEYFGWDDPAKMICDVLLHPAMTLTAHGKKHFFEQTLSIFRKQTQQIRGRIHALYPLHGLKWCLILLNEFIPDEQQRRRFAGNKDVDLQQLQNKQLAKARGMFQKTLSQHEDFIYGNCI